MMELYPISIWQQIQSYIFQIRIIAIIHIILFFSWKFFFTKPLNFFYAVIQIGCLNIINLALPLWLCFAFYFGIWHSILSFDKIRQEFEMENSFLGWKKLLTKAIPYAAVAWTGIIVFIYFKNIKISANEFNLKSKNPPDKAVYLPPAMNRCR